jgi:hypothetical protein
MEKRADALEPRGHPGVPIESLELVSDRIPHEGGVATELSKNGHGAAILRVAALGVERQEHALKR